LGLSEVDFYSGNGRQFFAFSPSISLEKKVAFYLSRFFGGVRGGFLFGHGTDKRGWTFIREGGLEIVKFACDLKPTKRLVGWVSSTLPLMEETSVSRPSPPDMGMGPLGWRQFRRVWHVSSDGARSPSPATGRTAADWVNEPQENESRETLILVLIEYNVLREKACDL